MKRPKVAAFAPVVVRIECRVCDKTVEGYTREAGYPLSPVEDPKNGERPLTTEDIAITCAFMMEKHLTDEHGYPRGS